MEQKHNRVHESSRRDAVSESSSPSLRTHNIRLSLDLSSQRVFTRTASLGRIGATGSWRLGSIRPNLIIEGISINQGDAVDQAPDLEMIENGSRQGSLNRMSSRDSWQRGSISFTSDRAVSLPRELLDQIDSSLAQVGCRGNRVDVKEIEDGFVTFADDALILSFASQSHEASLPSVVTPLTEEIVSPLPTDSILFSTEKSQMKNITPVKAI